MWLFPLLHPVPFWFSLYVLRSTYINNVKSQIKDQDFILNHLHPVSQGKHNPRGTFHIKGLQIKHDSTPRVIEFACINRSKLHKSF